MPARRIVVGLAALTLCTGGASLRPTSVIHGVSVYVRDGKTVDAYCRAHVRADNLAPVLYGCYVPADNLIMIAEGDEGNDRRVVAHGVSSPGPARPAGPRRSRGLPHILLYG